MAGGTLTSNLDSFREAALSCPIPAAVELIGEKWAFLILRGAFNGLQHFEEFQAGLGIARNILSDRLKRLVEAGLLTRADDPSHKQKAIYSLTEQGIELLPVLAHHDDRRLQRGQRRALRHGPGHDQPERPGPQIRAGDRRQVHRGKGCAEDQS